jgi:hypothetical protein
MICLLVVLFPGDRQTTAAEIVWPAAPAVRSIVLVLFGLCPLLSYVGWWSPYLSFRLYSHLYRQGAIVLTQPDIDALPASVRKHVQPTMLRRFAGILPLDEWAEQQLNAFPPTDLPVVKQLARNICAMSTNPREMYLLIDHPPAVLTGESEQEAIACDQLCGGKEATEDRTDPPPSSPWGSLLSSQ